MVYSIHLVGQNAWSHLTVAEAMQSSNNFSWALLTDLYQLTMAYGYWKQQRAEQGAVFNLFFRKLPFTGGYAICAGLDVVREYFQALHFAKDDLQYLATLTGNDNSRLFEHAFLDYLGDLQWSVDIDAMPEGTVAFANEPLLRVRGPILQCQLLETGLLNIVNFSTLIATKAARICSVAQGDPVLEFGLRRAQGPDGAMLASRSAYIGGCAATSNVMAGKRYGIPVKGTHAHSWVMSFESELDAFHSYAEALPNNCVFLVDTFDTLDGVHRACEVGKHLRERGHEMVGIRLDSGDLAYLSIEARQILDQAGFPDAVIVASNDLDEATIESLKNQGATIGLWGVGTKLATAYDQPALGGVYKLAAMQSLDGSWQPRIKLSEQPIKTSIPGMLQVRRYFYEDHYVADMIYDADIGITESDCVVDPYNDRRQKKIPTQATWQDLLQPVVRQGQWVGFQTALAEVRAHVQTQLQLLHPSIRRLLRPHEYPVGLEQGLSRRRQQLIRAHRELD